MAQAYRCDRCKTYFVKDMEYFKEKEIDVEKRLRIYRDNRSSLVCNFDLCPDCQEELQKWFYDTDATSEKTNLKGTEWIPVTERLPGKANKKYVVTLDNGEVENRWWLGCFWVESVGRVVAWTELPEPYKEGENEDA